MPSEMDSESDYEDYEIKFDSPIFTKLTEVVRAQYFNFLERQLVENVRTWQEECEPLQTKRVESIENSIHECAKLLEDLAIKEAILTQLYQREMIRTIATVKQSTKDKILLKQLAPFLNSNEQKTASKATSTHIVEYATKAIQTEDLQNVTDDKPALTLDERIDLFQAQLQKGSMDNVCTDNQDSYLCAKSQNCKKRRLSRQQRHSRSETQVLSPAALTWHSPTPPPTVQCFSKTSEQNVPVNSEVQLEEDEIAQELEKLFTDQETDLDEIFGIIPRAQSNCDLYTAKKSVVTPKTCSSNDRESPRQSTPEQTPATVSDTSKTVASNSNKEIFPTPVKDLRNSLWPCEAFMQKQKLSATLNRLIEEDIRWHDILKWQFSVLFGDEGFDDFALCSPSIELDEVLVSSCMRRISPWVVRHLMKPLNEGLIGNRFLFKKFAKKLAHHIIMENQYPDEYLIKNAIENYFCMHRAVMTVEDLDDINTITIGNNDQ